MIPEESYRQRIDAEVEMIIVQNQSFAPTMTEERI